MTLNHQKWGYVLPEEAYETIEGKEELLYLFTEFREKVLPLENCSEANITSLLYNLAVLVFSRLNDKLFISEKLIESGRILWTDEVGFGEFCSVCTANIIKFRNAVINRNPILAENESVNRLKL